jgi:voltage-gated potassium channel Kch
VLPGHPAPCVSASAHLVEHRGLIFTSAFRFVEIVDPPFFTQTNVNPFTFEYFSFITLSTVGYGDFSPANDAGRTLAMLEGVFGQIFLVTIVALVVSNLGVERRDLRHTMTDRGPAPDEAVVERVDPTGDPPTDPPDAVGDDGT